MNKDLNYIIYILEWIKWFLGIYVIVTMASFSTIFIFLYTKISKLFKKIEELKEEISSIKKSIYDINEINKEQDNNIKELQNFLENVRTKFKIKDE
jgi:uncharacterized phage infection (PIP) family protein YhgE